MNPRDRNGSNRAADVIEMGRLGEELVREYFEKNGFAVVMSEDQYDREKDMIVDGETVEVKTQLRIITENAFALDISQCDKITNVGRVIFVEFPQSKLSELDDIIIKIRQPNDRKPMKTIPYGKGRKPTAFYSLEDTTILAKIHARVDPRARRIWELSDSFYKTLPEDKK